MKFKGRTVLAVAAAGALAAPALAQQSGPVATYWVSAATSTGMNMSGMGQMGAGQGGEQAQPQPQPKPKRPGLGAMLGAAASGMVPGAGLFGGGRHDDSDQGGGGYGARGGGANDYRARMQGGGAPVRTLSLALGSNERPTGDPQAEHLIPPGLNMGPSLPLVTPQSAPAVESSGDAMPPQMQRPKGKMIIYWGCGEHAAAAPIVIDFATLGEGKAPNFPTIAVTAEHPPSPGRSATYGVWPNARDGKPVPADASLVGDHTVHGDYSPDIHFHLGPDHDFMAPLSITSHDPTPAGGVRVTWSQVPGATGYFAWMMGASMKDGRDNPTIIVWSSSMKPSVWGAMMDYLPPAEVRRLVAQQVVMAPSATECIVPSEVQQAGAMGMLSMIAYGDEVNVADPPRPASARTPWNLKYLVKVRYKSTTGMMLGVPGM
jgi:hypothetical protein